MRNLRIKTIGHLDSNKLTKFFEVIKHIAGRSVGKQVLLYR